MPGRLPLHRGHALPPQNPDVAGLSAGWNLDLDLAVRARHRQRRPEGRLRHRQLDGSVEVVAVALDAFLRLHANLDEEVAGRAAERALVALAPDSDALAVVDPGRNVDVERSVAQRAAEAVAIRARRLDDTTGPFAARAGALADELAEDALGDLLDAAGAAARVAGDGHRSVCCAVAATRVARVRGPNGDIDADSRECVFEGDRRAGHDIAAAGGASRAGRCLAEDRFAEERAEDVGEVAEVEIAGCEAAPTEAFAAVTVIRRAPIGVGEHLVRLRRLAKALVGVWRVGDVGMQLAGELAEGTLDLAVGGTSLDAEYLVVVAFSRRHQNVEGTGSDPAHYSSS